MVQSRIIATLSAFVVTVAIAVGVAPTSASAAPAAPVFTSAPSGVVASDHAAVSFYASGASYFECRLDGGAWNICDAVGAHHVEGLSAGAHTVDVRAVDNSNTRGPAASASWTVSDDQQTITWLDRPTGTYPDRAVVATFTAAQADYYACRVDSTDDAAWTFCTGSSSGYETVTDLPSGAHTLDVRSEVYVGGDYVHGPVAHTSFTIDDGLTLTWLDKPSGAQADRAVTARFSAARADYYQCRVDSADDAAWTFCTGSSSGYEALTELPRGVHTLDVRAAKYLSLIGDYEYGTVVTTTFTVDPPLAVTWVDRPSGTIADRAVVAVFSAARADYYQCRLDSTDDAAWTFCTGTSSGYEALTDLASGLHTLDVRAVEHVSAIGDYEYSDAVSTTFTVAPDRAVNMLWSPTTSGSSATFGFRSARAEYYQCRLDSSDDAAWTFCTGTSDGYDTETGLANGSHTLDVRSMEYLAVIADYEYGATTRVTWNVTTVTGSSLAVSFTAATPASDPVSWASYSYRAPAAVSYVCTWDGVAQPSCDNHFERGGLAAGVHTFTVRAVASNGSMGAIATRTATVAPGLTTTFLQRPATATPLSQAWTALAWTASGATSFDCALDGDPLVSCGDSRVHGLGGLTAGSHTFRVRATNTVGSSGPIASTTFDVEPPLVSSWLSPTPATITAPWVALAYTAAGASQFDCSLDAALVACGNGRAFSTGGLAEGPHTVRVQAYDSAGNTGPVLVYNFAVDVDLTTTFTQQPGDPTPVGLAAHAYTAYGATQFDCAYDSDTLSACGDGRASAVSGLADGQHTFTVQAYDSVGNHGARLTDTFTVDAGPVLDVFARPVATLPVDVVAFAYAAPGATSFECAVDGTAWASCPGWYIAAGVGDGAHVFHVRAYDAGGNHGAQVDVPFTVEARTPETTITNGPAFSTQAATADFTFVADEAATFACALDGTPLGSCTSPVHLGGLADGGHDFSVAATDGSGHTDLSPAHWAWTVDRTKPVLTITSAPSGTVSSSTASVSWTVNETVNAVDCSLDGAASTPCGNPQVMTGLADGPHTLVLRATDVAGNISDNVSVSWTVAHSTAPETTITSGPAAIGNVTTPTFGFTADRAATFECRLDGGAWVACTSPKTYPAIADGSHTFDVRATAAGSTDATPATATFIVDTHAPTVTITGGPTGLTSSRSGAVTFTVDESATSTCSLDGALPATCLASYAVSGLADGIHTVTVLATDLAGNVSVPKTRTWTVDGTAPDTTISAKPAALTNATSATFSFTSTESGSTFACARDGAAFAACTSGTAFTVTEGAHSFAVRATDAAGNTDATPATWSWTVDTTGPTTTIQSGPSGTVTATDASITFTADETATFECRLDGGSWAACSSPWSTTGLSQGSHTFDVRATDAAGNTGLAASRTWTVNVGAPTVTISSGPAAATRSTTAAFQFSADEPATFECSLDSGAWTSCVTGKTYTGMLDGSHNLLVRGTDTGGNTGVPAQWSWTVDTTGPTVAILSGPTGTVNTTAATFTFSVESGATLECNRDGTGWVTCPAPATWTGLTQGSHTLVVRGTDALGNVGPTVTRAWSVDTVGPVTTIAASGPANPTRLTTATFSFSANETSTFECRLDGGLWAACTSPKGYTALAEGSHTFSVRGTDVAGNLGAAASRTWRVDLTVPVVTITSGPATTTSSTSAAFTFTVNEPATFQCRLDAGSFAACSSPTSYAGLTAGSHTFSVRATDTAGNVSAVVTRSWTVQAPAVLTVTEAAVSTTGAALSGTGLGDEFRYRITVTNSGGGVATGATVATTLSADHRLLATPAGCSAAGLAVTCPLADLAPGTSVTIEVRARAGFGCTVLGTSGNDVLNGTAGSDVICGSGGGDTINGNGGNDTVYGYGNRTNGLLAGTSVSNQASLTWNAATTTTPAATVLVGGLDGNDTITTLGGADTIYAEEGDDVITAGAGNDVIRAGDGADDLSGGGGDDTLSGQAGDDVMYGQAGDDTLSGSDGNDYGNGGDGADIVSGDFGRDALLGGSGNDTVNGGGAPNNATALADPNDHYNRLYGNGQTDTCSRGPGTGINNTDYRDASCESPLPLTSYFKSSFGRLDRGPAIP